MTDTMRRAKIDLLNRKIAEYQTEIKRLQQVVKDLKEKKAKYTA